MPRPKKSRKVTKPPRMKGFKPFGIPACELKMLELSIEEYESLKLVNYDGLSQEESAIKMDVSRPTFTRIYNKALKIIAKGFVEGKGIEIVGGDYHFDDDWFRCKRCFKLIQGKDNHIPCRNCPAFGDQELTLI